MKLIKKTVTRGVIREEFHECPPDVDEATVTMYARAWVWHIFAAVLFPNSMGMSRPGCTSRP
jgi:hypothetical protein